MRCVEPSILIVDDEVDLSQTLCFALRQEGWKTSTVHDGATALASARTQPPPDVIVLDLMLPDMPGTEVCRALRSDPKTNGIPILILSAKDEEVDRVVGFEIGADDYVVKPFSTRELALRIKAIMRRRKEPGTQTPDYAAGELRLDPIAHRVWVGDEEISLTALEFKLLTTFMNRRGRAQTRDTLLHDVWGHTPGLPTRTVDTHIQRLRKKLGSAGDYIETLRGVGYRFRLGN